MVLALAAVARGAEAAGHGPAVLPENRKAEGGERVLGQRVPPSSQELWLQAEQVGAIVGGLVLEAGRPRGRASHALGEVRAGLLAKQIEE